MGITALRCGDGMSGLFLKDGARVVGAQRGLVEDFARQAVLTTAQKVFTTARKKFSRVTFNVHDREISAWDYYCYGLYRSGSAFRDKLISDFIHVVLARWVNDMSEEMRRLIEASACNVADAGDNAVLNFEIVRALVNAEITVLAIESGRMLEALYANGAYHQSIAKGASPL